MNWFPGKPRDTGVAAWGAVFEPTTATLAIAGIAVSAIGTGVAAYSAIQQGNAAASASNYNATVADQNAIAAQQQAQQDAQLQSARDKQLLGAQAAAYGASGVDSGSGSPLDVLGSTASNAELSRQTILYKGRLKAAGYNDESQLDAATAANAQSNAAFSASGILLSGAGQAAVKANALSGGAGSSLLTPSQLGSTDNVIKF